MKGLCRPMIRSSIGQLIYKSIQSIKQNSQVLVKRKCQLVFPREQLDQRKSGQSTVHASRIFLIPIHLRVTSDLAIQAAHYFP